MSHYYRIHGRVRDYSGVGIPALKVAIVPAHGTEFAFRHEVSTDVRGDYELNFDSYTGDQLFRDIHGTKHNTLGLRILVHTVDGELIASRAYDLEWNEFYCGDRIDLRAPRPLADTDDCGTHLPGHCERYHVSGQLLGADGNPLDGHEVRIFQRVFGESLELNSGTTNGCGQFDVEYLQHQRCLSRGPGIDIFLTASHSPSGTEVEVLRSALYTRPPAHLSVDLTVNASSGLSEFEEGVAKLLPHTADLDPRAMATTEFNDNDVAWLSFATGMREGDVAAIWLACEIHAQWREDDYQDSPVTAGELSVEAVYAWIRQNWGFELFSMSLYDAGELAQSLETAVEQNIVPEFTHPTAADCASALVAHLGRPQSLDGSSRCGKVLELGAFSGTDEQVKAAKIDFLEYYETWSGVAAEYWSDYATHVASEGLSVNVAALQTQVVLTTLVGGHLELVPVLLGDLPAQSPEHIESLAALSVQDWKTKLSSLSAPPPFPGGSVAQRQENMAVAIHRSFERSYPTISVFNSLKREVQNLNILQLDADDIGDFALQLPNFDLSSTIIDELIAELDADPEYSAPPSQSPEMIQALKVLQRLYALVPGFGPASAMGSMFHAGIHSSRQILDRGIEEYVEEFEDVFGGRSLAAASFRRAEQIDRVVTETVLRSSTGLNPGLLGMEPTSVTTSDDSNIRGPNLELLFGALDHCACRECASIVSPAAYQVDLLRLGGEIGLKALGCALFEGCPPSPTTEFECTGFPQYLYRRGDICKIVLNCSNTDTVMPYIDIVNEVMEDVVVWLGTVEPDGDVWFKRQSLYLEETEIEAARQRWSKRQTSLSSDEIELYPEHLEREAYDVLANPMPFVNAPGQQYWPALQPWNLPYDLRLEEVRSYLDLTDVSRYQLLDAFWDEVPLRAALETLNLSVPVGAIITDTTPPDGTANSSLQNIVWNGQARPFPLSEDARFESVELFMENAQVDLDAAFTMMNTHWAGRVQNRLRDVGIRDNDGNETCILSDSKWYAPRDGSSFGTQFDRLSRIHRFSRLLLNIRDQGWTAFGLDEAILVSTQNQAVAELDDACLEELATIDRLSQRISTHSKMELLSWLGHLECRPDKLQLENGHQSVRTTLYAEVFQDRTKFSDESLLEKFDVEYRGVDRVELTHSGDVIDDSIAHAIASALSIEPTELELLFAGLSLNVDSSGSSPVPVLSLSNLSQLLRHVSLARAFDMSISEVVEFFALIGTPWFELAGVDDVPVRNMLPKQIVAQLDSVERAGWTVSELRFALNNVLPDEQGFVRSKADSLRDLLGIFARIAQQVQELENLDIAGGESVIDQLDAEFDLLRADEFAGNSAPLDDLRAIVHLDVSAVPPALWATTVNLLDPRIFAPSAPGFTGLLYEDYLDLDSPELNTVGARARVLVIELRKYQLYKVIPRQINEDLLNLLDVDPEVASEILARYGHSQTLAEQVLDSALHESLAADEIAVLLALSDADFLSQTSTKSELQAAYQSLRGVQRAALWSHRFELSAPALRWLWAFNDSSTTNHEHLGLISILDLGFSSNFAYDDFAAYTRFVELSERRFSSRALFHELVQLTHEQVDTALVSTDLLARLADVVAAEIEDLEFAAGAGQLALTYGDALGMSKLLRLLDRAELAAQLGTTQQVISSWFPRADFLIDTEHSHDVANEVRLQARSNYSSSEWFSAAVPVRDDLRVRQRNALLAYFTSGTRPEYDPYDYFLLDVGASSCVRTSRIRAALSSLQQFYAQWLLGMDKGVRNVGGSHLAQRIERRWPAMSRYRIWEANRQVLLYPENWLDPRLRGDKSPEFRTLETDLLSGDLDEYHIESNLAAYIESIDKISRLQINGIFQERESDVDNVGTRDVLHIFGRRRGRSDACYYRQRVGCDDATYYTPWESLPFEVDARDVLPVVFLRRLFLFWPVFDKKPDQERRGDLAAGSGGRVKDHYEVRLRYTVLQFGKWSKPRTTTPYLLALAHQEETSPFICPEHNSDEICDSAFAESEILRLIRQMPESEPWKRPGKRSEIFIESEYIAGGTLRVHVRMLLRDEPSKKSLFEIGAFDFGGCDGDARVLPLHHLATRGVEQPPETRQSRQGFFGNEEDFHLPTGTKLWQGRSDDHEIIFERHRQFSDSSSAVYQDSRRSFVVSPENGSGGGCVPTEDHFRLGHALNASTLQLVPAQAQRDAAPEELEDSEIRGYRPTGDYLARTNYHPYSCFLRGQVHRDGIDGIYRPASDKDVGNKVENLVRQQSRATLFSRKKADGRRFTAKSDLASPFPIEDYSFSSADPYASYNWELFYHAPMLVADELRRRRRFSEARSWLHYIFDPTLTDVGGTGVDYWKIKPFSNVPLSISDLLSLLNSVALGDSTDKNDIDLVLEFRAQIRLSLEHPFAPHEIARTRVAAYMMNTVMAYVDNLIEWADDLFRQASIESVSEATQLYILAANILGRRPEQTPEQELDERDFCSIRDQLDDLGNTLAEVENIVCGVGRDSWAPNPVLTPNRAELQTVPAPLPQGAVSLDYRDRGRAIELISVMDDETEVRSLYFCTPYNERLVARWDRVEDRLFKVRNCLDLNGNARAIRLFEPPIDPGAIISALAGGAGLAGALRDLSSPAPNYRFVHYIEVAKTFVDEVVKLGDELLQAIESKDSEALALLQNAHQQTLLEKVSDLLAAQVEEAEGSLAAAEAVVPVIQDRIRFYNSRDARIAEEKVQEKLAITSMVLNQVAAKLSMTAGLMALIPDFQFGISGAFSPVFGTQFGGYSVGGMMDAMATGIRGEAATLGEAAEIANVQSGWQRRDEAWQLQRDQADIEFKRAHAQIAVSKQGVESLNREITRHERNMAQVEVVRDFLSEKYTREELYDWMSGQICDLHRQAYDLALDVSLRAERCLERELGVERGNRIGLDHYDDAHRGLVAGRRLRQDLRALEAAYMAGHGRELEIEKRFNLAALDPGSLLALQESGSCIIDIPELIYDLDHPGHFFRRIVDVRLSVLGNRGPYAQANAELTLLRSQVRTSVSTSVPPMDNDGNVRHDDAQGQRTMAFSGGVDDTGRFPGGRGSSMYHPFEHRGAVSTWELRLPGKESLALQRSTISEVVLTIRYTARDGGEVYRDHVQGTLAGRFGNPRANNPTQVGGREFPGAPGLMWRALSMRSSFPSVWQSWRDGSITSLDLEVSRATLGLSELNENVGAEFDVYSALIFNSESDVGPTASIQLGSNPAESLDAAPATLGARVKIWGGTDSAKLNSLTLIGDQGVAFG